MVLLYSVSTTWLFYKLDILSETHYFKDKIICKEVSDSVSEVQEQERGDKVLVACKPERPTDIV